MLAISQILQFLVIFSLGIPVLIFGLYGMILFYYNKQSGKNRDENIYNKDIKFEPTVSIVIPTHNEEAIISKKIENLLASDYPKDKIEIIFVDDSDDSTARIIQEYSKRYSEIRLLSFRKRMGYSPSMIAGCKDAKGEIIVLCDAGSFFDGQTLSNLVRHFRNPNIGAVTGRDVILNVVEEVGSSEELYQKFYNFLRRAETNMDSTFYFKGEASAVRKNLINDLERCDATFDTTVALFVRQKGYKAIYDPEAKFYEYAPKTHSGRVRQKTIRAANVIKVLFKFRSMVFNPKYGKFGSIVLPMNLAMLVVTPLSMLSGTVFLVALVFFDMAFSSVVLSILGVLFILSLIFLKPLLFTFLELGYSLLKAMYEVIFTKRIHDKIEKVVSTRR